MREEEREREKEGERERERKKKKRQMLTNRDRNAPRHQKIPGRRGRARAM